MRFFYSIALAGLLLALVSGDALAQVRVPGRSAARKPATTVKIGKLQRSAANGPYFQLDDGLSGSQVRVTGAEGIDLGQYVDQDVVLHGGFKLGPDGRRDVFVVERIVPMQPKQLDAEPVATKRTRAAKSQTRQASYEEESSDESFEVQPAQYTAPEPIDPPAASAMPMHGLPPATPDYIGNFGPYQPGYPPGPPIGPTTPGAYWIRGEYIYWVPDGMRLPPLVTTSPAGTARSRAGVLGETGTSVLFGDGEVNDDGSSGFRIRGGFWMNPTRSIGLEGEYFQLGDITTSFSATSNGSTILARPFFDAEAGQETAELVAFPNLIRGTVSADATTEVMGAGGRFRFNLCCGETGCCEDGGCGFCGGGNSGYRVDWLGGYRFLRLEDTVVIREDLVSLETANPGSFLLRDEFHTRNEFHGGEIGAVYEATRGRWVLELLTKVAIGQNRQLVRIAGDTQITENGTPELFTGGLLAQRTNIGTYEREVFSVVPEIGATLGFQITPSWRAMVGYSLVYFGNMVRAGDQIDLDVNPNLLPPEATPFTGPLRPEFAFDETDFWMHGVNVGIEFRR